MKLINISTPMFPNTFAQVDDGDYDALIQYKWTATKPHKVIYAIRGVTVAGAHTTIRMHQQIMGKFETIDHRDGDGLNNQRGNLRACTDRQNGQNRRKTHGVSRFKGVSWHKHMKRWRSTIVVDSKQRTIGYFGCEGCAASAYDNAARAAFGEFACLNSYS